MKKLIYFIAIFLFITSCGNSPKTNTKVDDNVFSVDEIQKSGDEFIDKTVVVIGTVSHVCKHSGQRCFLMGSDEDVTIRVEAGKKFGSFTQDQMGSELKVTGILREIRIDDAYVSEMETSANEGESANKDHALGHDGEGNHEVDGGNHDSDEQKRIAELRKEIEASKKGYISIFYMDGEKYETIQ